MKEKKPNKRRDYFRDRYLNKKHGQNIRRIKPLEGFKLVKFFGIEIVAASGACESAEIAATTFSCQRSV